MGAYVELNKARGNYLQALSKYLITWKDGIAGAGNRMQVANGVTAVVLITAGTAAYLVSAAAAVGTTLTTAEAVTAATTHGPRVQAAMRAFVKASTSEEAAAGERLIE